jgi:hypothetical protein
MKVHYGWDGSNWVIGNSGSRVTHADSKYIPHNISLGFNDAPLPYRSFRTLDYYSFYVHPSGWLKDNLEELTLYDSIYCWNTHYEENEPHTITDSTITLDATLDPNFYCIDGTIYCGSYHIYLESDPSIEFQRLYNFNPTSSTTNTGSYGLKTFTLDQTDLNYTVGQSIICYWTSNSGYYLQGTVSSYSGTTLIVNVTYYTNGSANSSWYFTSTWKTPGHNQYFIDVSNNNKFEFSPLDEDVDILVSYLWLGYEW